MSGSKVECVRSLLDKPHHHTNNGASPEVGVAVRSVE